MAQVLRYFHQDPKKSVQSSSTQQIITLMSLSINNNTQALGDKQNTIPGKSLSSNDFTDYYKNKLKGIEEEAEVNVQANWDENDSTADSYIQNKPGIDTVVTEDSNNLITSGAVFNAIDELPEPMIFKGSLGTGGTIQVLPTADNTNVGYTYKVITAGTYDGKTAKPGDTYISDGTEWILIPSGDEPSGTVTNVAMTVPTGLSVSGSPITTSGTLAITYAVGYAIPTLTDQATWTAKQDAISDLSTIRSRADEGHTSYGWGNHANAGYLMAISDLATIRSRADEGHAAYGWGDHSLAGYQAAISDLATIRSRSDEGHTAYGWGDHSQAGYVKSSGVTSVSMTVPTGLSISGSPITSTGTLALSFANGYSIPTTTKLSNWDTAYSWGDHASAGYIKSYVNTTYKLKLNNTTNGDSTNGVDLGTFYAPTSSGTGFLKGTKSGDNITWSWDNSTYNNYSLPLAASDTRGGVKIGFTTNATNRNYAVLLSNELMYVNVPWTDNNNYGVDVQNLDSVTDSTWYYFALAGNKTETNTNVKAVEKITYHLEDKKSTIKVGKSGVSGQLLLFDGTTNCGCFLNYSGNTDLVIQTLPDTSGTILNTGTTSFTRSLASGTKIGTLKINNESTDLYCQTNTNTTYTIATGDSNGLIKITPSSGNAYNVSVKGLGSRAYDSTDYLPLSGGTMTGNISISKDTNITWSRNTDYAKIHFANTGDGDTNSYMGFETGDNGNEYFRFGHTQSSTYTEWASIKSDGIRVGGTKVSLEGHTHSYLPLSGGTMTGPITVSGQPLYFGKAGSNAVLVYNSTYPNYGIWYKDANLDQMMLSASNNANDPSTADFCINGGGDGVLTSRGNKIWHAGNDGTGSGLDADLLDGKHASEFSLTSHTHDGRYLRDVSHDTDWTTVETTPTDLAAGLHRIHVSGKEYSSILTGYSYTGAYWQLYFHPNNGYAEDIKYRASNCTSWKTLLDSNNSSVSGGGSDYGSSISVKINGTTKTLTMSPYIPHTRVNYNTSYPIAGQACPLDMAFEPRLRGNVLASVLPAMVKIERSSDGGLSWSEVSFSDSNKLKLFRTDTSVFSAVASGNATVNNRLRITITCNRGSIYFNLLELLMWFCTSGAGGTKCEVSYLKFNSSSYTVLNTYPIDGWSGWNSIPVNLGNCGGFANDTRDFIKYLRFTFYMTSVSSGTANFYISSIRGFGLGVYTGATTLSKESHPYFYDEYCNVTFESDVITKGLLVISSSEQPILIKNNSTYGAFINIRPSNQDSNYFRVGVQKNATYFGIIPIKNGSWPSKYFAMDLDGNVGIGTNAPSYLLHVNGTAKADSLYIGENLFTTTSNYLTIACKSNEVVLAGDNSTMYFNYRTYTGKTIPTTFKWNAGASNAWAAHDMGSLTARGTVDIYPTGSRSGTGVQISHGSSFEGPQIVLDPLCTDSVIGTGTDYSVIALSKTAGTMYIRYPAGKTLSVGPFNLSTAYGYFNSSGGWTGPSDASLKKDIYKPSKTESHDIWEWLVEKGFKRFTWINTEKHDIGAIAQEVLEILPEVVDYNESTKLYGLDYTKLHSHAISSIVQELKDTKEEIKLLQALIAELKLLLNN